MTSTPWTTADIPDQGGRTHVVTGANSGLGRETASALVAAGAHVVLAVRDTAKGEATRAELSGPGSSEVRPLDLADLASVRAFVDAWDRPLDVLVNNAGVMAVPHGRTADGFERQIGTNHLGPFALTNLLLSRLTDRVVTVSSSMHRRGRIDLEDLNWERRRYQRWAAYGQSKLANLLFTFELQRRLDAAGRPLRALAAHPGYASTELQTHTGNLLQGGLMAIGNRLFAQSASMGALPTLYAATVDLPGSSFAGPGGLQEARGHPVLVGHSRRAGDDDVAGRLWEQSERLTGTAFVAPSRS